MLAKITFYFLLVTLTSGEPTVHGIDRTVEGARSLGYQIIYGDEELTMFNEVVNDVERNAAKSKIKLNNVIKPLPVQDVKCLMSADHYCSKDMKKTKSIIIEAVKNDCKECSKAQKEDAGKVIAAMMTHDHAAWKLFLTRTALLIKPERKTLKPEKEPRYKEVGEPEEVIGNIKFALPGVKVRARRYTLEEIKE